MNHAGLHDVRAGFFLMVGFDDVGFHLRGRCVKHRDASGSVGRSKICLILSWFFAGLSFTIGHR